MAEIDLLESEVKDKLLSLNLSARLRTTEEIPGTVATRARTGLADYDQGLEERFVRSGVFRRSPVRIYSAQRQHRSREFSLSPDGLAHLLTSLSPELAAGISGAVREIVILPELVLHSECLLTHVFVPERSLLAFYLYPRRFHDSPAAAYPERFQLHGRTTGAGLLPALCRSLAKATDNAAPGQHSDEDRILKFLIPRDLTRAGEIEAMQAIHDRYRKFRLD